MLTRLLTRSLAAALVALSLALAACAHPRAAARLDVQGWEASLPPAAGCAVRVSAGGAPKADRSEGAGGTGALVVRLTSFDSAQPVVGAQVVFTPLGVQVPAPVAAAYSSDTSVARTVAGLAAGRYAMLVRRLGYWPRTDTVAVRAGAMDTVDVATESFHDGFRNVHNCRPHGFRRAGELACVTDSEESESALDRARHFTTPASRRGFRLPPGDSAGATVVRDERLCERAGRAYGGPGSPPRRVVVVAVGGLYVVYDPYEPETAGEWDIWKVFDRRWRVLVNIAS